MLAALDLTTRDAIARRHWPDGMAFDAEHEELLRRGWPFLKRIGPDVEKPAALAKKHLRSNDPILFVDWPRNVARLFVRAMATVDRGIAPEVKIDANDEGLVDVEVLDRLLGRMGLLGYSFLMADALFLAEQFVGSRVAAERTIAALERFEPQRANDRPALWAIECFGCLEHFVLRADARAFNEEIEERLRAIATARAGTLVGHRARLTVEGPSAYPAMKDLFAYDVDHLRIDEASIDAYLAHEYADWLFTPQVARMFGAERAPTKLASAAKRQPAWKQEERCISFGPIRHRFVGELMAGMVGSRGAKGLPEAWLAAHPELAPTGAPSAPKKKVRRPSGKTVDATVQSALVTLTNALAKVRGDASAEVEAIRACVHAIIEIRAASGEVLPEAHVGHVLMLDGWAGAPAPLAIDATDAERDRWSRAIDDASRD